MFERDNSSNNTMKAFDIKHDNPKEDDKDDNKIPTSKKRIILLLIVVMALLGVGVIYNIIDHNKTGTSLVKDETSSMFLPMDEITVNLRNSGDGSSTWLRVKVSLEIQGQTNYDSALKMIPKILDIFQIYLKELRKTDLDGSFGIYKMKDEIAMRINTILYPNGIKGILFQEIIVQTN